MYLSWPNKEMVQLQFEGVLCHIGMSFTPTPDESDDDEGFVVVLVCPEYKGYQTFFSVFCPYECFPNADPTGFTHEILPNGEIANVLHIEEKLAALLDEQDNRNIYYYFEPYNSDEGPDDCDVYTRYIEDYDIDLRDRGCDD